MTTDATVTLDDRFSRLVISTTRLEKLYEGCRWAEGLAYFPAGRYLVWSDIPNDRMMRYDETSNSISVFRAPAGYSNGNMVDRQGRLVTCEHGNRRVTRTEHDGSTPVITSHHEGKRLNSPNDAVVKSDGSIRFTDPAHGIDSDYEGYKGRARSAGAMSIASTRTAAPSASWWTTSLARTGLPSRRTRRNYIVGMGATHVPDGPRHMRVFDVGEDGELSGRGLRILHQRPLRRLQVGRCPSSTTGSRLKPWKD